MSTINELLGMAVLKNSQLNKSTAFSKEERARLKLRGLLPAAVGDQNIQVDRVLANLRRKGDDIERYIFLRALQARNKRLFYRIVLEHIEEIMPLVYTPTVGQACREFAHIFRQSEGFYITPEDSGEVRSILDNWPAEDVKVIVVTDGERILGLGDLGANGMGIPIGKLALYTACAGISPHECLPVMLDVGTDNIELREDPLYLGMAAKRLRGPEYLQLMDEFVAAANDKYPGVLIQFEDFATPNAITLLDRFRTQTLCFNDDIQGTATVVLAGIYAYSRATQQHFTELRFVFLGAGSANLGTASLLVAAFEQAGIDEQTAKDRIWFVDIEGLVTSDRANLPEHIAPFARQHTPADFVTTLRAARPHMLIGATGAPGSFTQQVIEIMAELNERPAIFALSNPTESAECTAKQAYRWSNGRAIFASGSPFAAVHYFGQLHKPGQSNNVYVFPGLGRGAVLSSAKQLPDIAFLAAAHTLAEIVDDAALASGTLYPELAQIREVSLAIAVAVADTVFDAQLSRCKRPKDLQATLRSNLYEVVY